MKSSFEIQSVLYRALNVTAITSLIDGGIYKGAIPATSQKQDIEINVLSNLNSYLQTGYVNVNFYCMQQLEGTPDNKKLSTVNDALMALLDKKQIEEIHFQVENQSGALKDNEPGRDGLFYTNLKIKFNNLN